MTSIDLAYCFQVARGQAVPDETLCPGFIPPEVEAAAQNCEEVGGNLAPAAAATAWTADFNGDQKPEYLFEFSANLYCVGAPSLFSCGSLGCPVGLYERRDGSWRSIGAVGEGEPESLEILAGDGRSGHRDFRTGCIDGGPCAEHAYFQWAGEGYEMTKLEVRGFDVDVKGSPHGLANIPRGAAVLAMPKPDADVLDRYAEGAEVAMLGQAGEYFYVSPCNACQSGFVPKSVVSAL